MDGFSNFPDLDDFDNEMDFAFIIPDKKMIDEDNTFMTGLYDEVHSKEKLTRIIDNI